MSFERPLFIEMIRSEVRDYSDRARKAGKANQVPEPEPARTLFTVHTGNQWIELERLQPEPKMLFGEFWHEGELCILFADTNAGKSVLAVQIGNSLTRCEPLTPFVNHADPSNVLYIDFELTGKQFQQRYSTPHQSYDFGNGFYRAQFNPEAPIPPAFKTFDEFINAALEHYIKKTGASVLIIDNITCLRNGTEHASEALPLMKHLKALKTRHSLSILVLAHTPKRNPAKPITADDLQGSKMLINFADSAFAIGKSNHHPAQRYLKQVKQRSTAQQYGEANICLARITKPGTFLRFEFDGFGDERPLLRSHTAAARQLLMQQVAECSARGLSQRQISRQLKIGLATVNRLLRDAG